MLSLYLFGGEVLRGFAFTMLVGIVSGTYSTIFIASAIAILLSQQKRSSAASAQAAGQAAPDGPSGASRAEVTRRKGVVKRRQRPV